MRLLFAIKSMAVQGGGAEKVLADIANGLFGRGYKVDILTFDEPVASFFDLAAGIGRHDMACNEPGMPTRPMAFLGAAPRIRRTVRALQPDVVIGFMHSMYVPLTATLLGTGIPMIASEHIDASHYAGRPVQRRLRRWAEGRAALVTVPSEAACASFRDAGEPDRIVIANPVDLTPYAPAVGTVVGTPPLLLSVGRFMDQKDHATLLIAFAQVAPEFPDWRLRLVGDGVLRPQLETQRRALGLEERVEMPGYTRDVAAAYAGARCVVLPSLYESFGLVAAEALASGRPVLAFDDCAGVAEIVANGENGVLVSGVPDRAIRARNLAAGLRRLMSDPALCARLGAAGPAAVARFDLPAVLDRWEEAFRLATGRSHRRPA